MLTTKAMKAVDMIQMISSGLVSSLSLLLQVMFTLTLLVTQALQ